MFGLGFPEILIILLIILLVFGAGWLPGLSGGLGRAIKNFRHALRGSPDAKSGPRREGEDEGER